MKKNFTLLLFLFSVCLVHGQSTQGTDFWVGLLTSTIDYKVDIHISAKTACSGTIINPYSGYSTSFTVAAGSVTSVSIPISEVINKDSEVVTHQAIHIQATDTVSVFSWNNSLAGGDASFCIPTPVLGSAYRIFTYTPNSIQPNYSEALIIGVKDNTEVEIVPTQNTTGTMLAGNTYTVTLNEGETYRFSSTNDLTGTLIRTKDPCGQVAVISGVEIGYVPANCTMGDHIYEQLLPVETWGRSFFCTPFLTKRYDIYRVVASIDNTTIHLGTDTKKLDAGQFFDTTIYQKALAITADRPIAVMGYTGFCAGGGEADMYWVSCTEQKLYNIIFSKFAIVIRDSDFVNIVVNIADTAWVKLNGTSISKPFKVDPDYPQFAYAQILLTSSINTLVCDKGFIATYSSSHSYAYSAGSGMQRLNNDLPLVNGTVFNINDTIELCAHKPYQFGSFTRGTLAWNFGEDSTEEEFPVHTFNDTGYFSISFYPTTTSCSWAILDTLVFSVHVNAVCLSVVPDTLVCRGQKVKLQTLSTNPRLEHCRKNEWYSDNISIGRDSALVTPLVTTIYKVISTDTCVGTKDSSYVQVMVRPPVIPSLNRDTTICKGNTVRLSAKATGGDSTYIYTWSNGISGSGFIDTTVAPDVTTTYTITVDDECSTPTSKTSMTVYVRPDLDIVLSANTTLCTGDTLIVHSLVSGGDSSYNYQWSYANNTADSLIFIADTSTTIQVRLSDGCTIKPDTAQVTIFVRPNPKIIALGDTTICAGGTANLHAYGILGDSSYIINWTGLGQGEIKQVDPPITAIYQVSVDDECSALGDTASILVHVLPPLSAGISTDTTICTGQSVELKAKGQGGNGNYNYSWDQGLGNTDIQQVTPVSTTTYRFILSDDCTVKNDTVYTTVYVRPPLGLTVNNDTVICLGESVELKAIGSGGDSTYTFTWDQGLGSGPNHIITPNSSTTYTVILKDDCSPQIQEQVTVSIEDKPVLDFTLTPTEICEGKVVQFTNLTVGNYSYTWHFGDQQTSPNTNPEHRYTSQGSYDIRLVTTTPLGCRDSLTKTNAVQVYPHPEAGFTMDPEKTDLLKPEISFTNTSQSASSWLWDFGDLESSADENPKHTYADSGWYKITLYVSNDHQCNDTAYGHVRVNDYYRVYVPSAFSPNGDGTNDVFEAKGRGILAYHITIYNRWGEMVFESFDIATSWTGKLPNQGRPSPDNVYYYMLDIRDITQQRHIYQGRIVLLK